MKEDGNKREPTEMPLRDVNGASMCWETWFIYTLKSCTYAVLLSHSLFRSKPKLGFFIIIIIKIYLFDTNFFYFIKKKSTATFLFCFHLLFYPVLRYFHVFQCQEKW